MPCLARTIASILSDHLGVLLEVGLRVLAPLTDALAPEGEPGAALLDDVQLDARSTTSPEREMPWP